MIPVKIISTVDIPAIEESVMADLIEAEILRNNPEIEVTGIVFERKLNPQRMEAIVDAQVRGSTPAEVPTKDQPEFPEESMSAGQNKAEAEAEATEEKPKRKKVFG